MRDQCGVIFKQAKKELEAVGLLNTNPQSDTATTTTTSTVTTTAAPEESVAGDIDKELQKLQVTI